MPPVEPTSRPPIVPPELIDFQKTMYDKATTYTKVIMGLGYGGFFAAWSGTKGYLSPKLLVGSALLVTFSLVLFVLYEICETMISSYLSVDFANTLSKPGINVSAALLAHKDKMSRSVRPLLSLWKVTFPLSALTGLSGAGILIYAFVASLVRMWAA
ncbi:MAG TPA: hypothetical protein VFQ24_03750 [Terriglobia bacterium]|nr:hypothetical protein [Terriglobia bacterium]